MESKGEKDFLAFSHFSYVYSSVIQLQSINERSERLN